MVVSLAVGCFCFRQQVPIPIGQTAINTFKHASHERADRAEAPLPGPLFVLFAFARIVAELLLQIGFLLFLKVARSLMALLFPLRVLVHIEHTT